MALKEIIDIEELYENAPCGYFSFLPDGKLIKANKTFFKWVGINDNDLESYRFIDFLFKGNSIYYEMIFLPKLKMQGFLNEINFDIVKKDGTTFPGLINAVAVRDESHNLKAVNVTLFDITERKKYEQELLRTKKEADLEKLKFEILSNQLPAIIWSTNDSGELDFLNQQYFKSIDKKYQKKKSAVIADLINDKDLPTFRIRWHEAKLNNLPLEVEVRLKYDPADNWYLLRGVPFIRDDFSENQDRSWIGTFTNISHQVKTLQLKDDFLSIASHELKTPITIVSSYLEILKEVIEDGTQLKLIERCENSMNSMQTLINSLLDITQLNQEELPIEKKKENLSEIVVNCVNSHEKIHKELNIQFRMDIKNAYVMADKMRIEQIINNLINNAIKYSPGSDKIVVTLEKPEPCKVKFSVKDFGIGISEEDLPKIFDRYYRVKSKSSQYIKGWGLGLYIIQQIVKAHNSIIKVESEPGKGSCFYFTMDLVD